IRDRNVTGVQTCALPISIRFHAYLEIQLAGECPNMHGIGSQLVLTAGGQKQYLYQSPYRGYMSTMDDRAHFGLVRAGRVDSLQEIGRASCRERVEVWGVA